MKSLLIATTCLLCLTATACTDLEIKPIDGSTPVGEMGQCPSPPDLRMPAAKCAAAKGLSGDNLICVDFTTLPDQPLDTPPPTALAGWDFTTNCGGKHWEIAAGKLQIKSFNTFGTSCGFLMPAINLNDADKQKYQSLTLSVIQRVEINDPNQTATMYLGAAITNRAFWDKTGKRERQQLMISMAKTDPVPTLAGQNYQYLFQIVSAGNFSLPGWQIESIAVNGNLP